MLELNNVDTLANFYYLPYFEMSLLIWTFIKQMFKQMSFRKGVRDSIHMRNIINVIF